MADETIIDPSNEPSEAQKRITQLSEKVRLTSEERDEQKRLLGERDVKIAELERENTFNSGFMDVLGSHPAAKDHKDEIKEKVLAGYTPEDATYAVLGKVGKLGAPKAPDSVSPAGGSAAISVPQSGGIKAPHEMNKEELRTAVLAAQDRGDIALT